MGWMAVGKSVTNGTLWDTRQTPRGNTALPIMGALLGGLHSNPAICGNKTTTTNEHLEYKEHSRQGQLLCLEAPQGTTEQNPRTQGASETPVTWEEHLSPSSLSSENLEGLTEKVGTLGLQSLRNSCGAAKKRAKARLAEAPIGNSGSGQPQASRASQPQNLQKPGTSEAQRKTKERTKHESSSTERESSERKGHLKGPGKWQRSSGGTPKGGQAKRPKQVGQLSYTRVTGEGIRMAIVGEGYLGTQISR
jgi:hypothetical protein